MLRFTLGIVLLAGMSSALQGGVVARDYRAPGDGLLTYDDVNHREWLDLTETLNWNLSTLDVALSDDGALAGFNHATLTDVQGLTSSAEVTWFSGPHLPGADGPAAWMFIELLGDTYEEEKDDAFDEPSDVLCCDYDDLVIIDPLEALGFRSSTGYVNTTRTPGRPGLPIVSAYSVGEPLRQNSPLNNPLYQEFVAGGIYYDEFSVIAIEDHIPGPYWLYRAVPEPNTCACIVLFTGWLATCRRSCFFAT